MKTEKLIFLVALLLLVTCKKNDDAPIDPVDKLPAATQVGAQTFGCLVDGEVFLPKKFGQNILQAFLQNIDGKLFLVVSTANDKGADLNIQGLKFDVLEEKTYQLITEREGGFNAVYITGNAQNLMILGTKDDKPGLLTITNYDPENFILSGTFEFTVLDNDGNEIKITDGRFDVKYTN